MKALSNQGFFRFWDFCVALDCAGLGFAALDCPRLRSGTGFFLM
jgi:hypothetical protein